MDVCQCLSASLYRQRTPERKKETRKEGKKERKFHVVYYDSVKIIHLERWQAFRTDETSRGDESL
jgi:hypothetical protein